MHVGSPEIVIGRLLFVVLLMVFIVMMVMMAVRVIVAVRMSMGMPVSVAMVVMMSVFAQQEDAGHIDHEPDDGDQHRFIKGDGQGIDQALNRLPDHEQGHQPQHDGARVAAKDFHLSDPEGETAIPGVLAGIAIGKDRKAERASVGRHMPAIGQKRHRVEPYTGGNLQHHHDEGEQDNGHCPSFIGLTGFGIQKSVVVSPRIELMNVHGHLPGLACMKEIRLGLLYFALRIC